jgi:hypothetical protein
VITPVVVSVMVLGSPWMSLLTDPDLLYSLSLLLYNKGCRNTAFAGAPNEHHQLVKPAGRQKI